MNTGISWLTVGRISCARTDVDTGPIWPPASMPSMTNASTFERINFFASASAGANAISFAPLLLILSIAQPGGSPPASTTWPTPCLMQTSISSARSGCMVMRLTPNGRCELGIVLGHQHRDFDLRGRDGEDVDPAFGQRLEHLGHDSGVGAHADADRADLHHVGVGDDGVEADRALRFLELRDGMGEG